MILSIDQTDLVKFLVLLIFLGLLYGLYSLGHKIGVNSVNDNATVYICTRKNNPAPKDWCNSTLLHEVFEQPKTGTLNGKQ